MFPVKHAASEQRVSGGRSPREAIRARLDLLKGRNRASTSVEPKPEERYFGRRPHSLLRRFAYEHPSAYGQEGGPALRCHRGGSEPSSGHQLVLASPCGVPAENLSPTLLHLDTLLETQHT